MSYIIDRRLNAKNKSTVNRQRFLRRYKKHIKKAVADAVSQRSITDINKGEQISIPSKDVSEPSFHHGKGGYNENILPGNKEFIAGDHFPRPKGGQGGPGSGASDSGEGMDEFVFQITQEEFLDFLFEELELPNLVKHQLKGDEEFRSRRAGISNEGSPGQVNIVRSLRAANARRLALTGGKRRQVKILEHELSQLQVEPIDDCHQPRISALLQKIDDIKSKIKRVPWLDDFDLKYNLQVREPVPRTKAVMFCIMDVSGSMSQSTKDIAKRFFILLYLFLQRNYEHTEVIFIRHHTSAKEVDEQEFFYSRETGGTIVSSALILMKEIIDKRFPVGEWNIYGAQASDGDNWNDDSIQCLNILTKSLIPLVQFFSYIEITPHGHQALWREYEKVKSAFPKNFSIQQITEVADIYPVFRDLFQKKTAVV